MTSLETMAAAQLAIALNGFPSVYSGNIYRNKCDIRAYDIKFVFFFALLGLLPFPFVQQLHSSSAEDAASATSPPATLTSSPVESTGEQPLDLSAKSSGGSPFPSDSKQVFR